MSKTLEEALAFFDSADQTLQKTYAPPAGFFTVGNLARAKGVGYSTMKSKLEAMARHGLVEVREHRLRTTVTKVYGNFKNDKRRS
jgi:Fic family protein